MILLAVATSTVRPSTKPPEMPITRCAPVRMGISGMPLQKAAIYLVGYCPTPPGWKALPCVGVSVATLGMDRSALGLSTVQQCRMPMATSTIMSVIVIPGTLGIVQPTHVI